MDRKHFRSLTSQLRMALFGISPKETSFEYRGFNLENPEARRHLQAVPEHFVIGYHFALSEYDLQHLIEKLHTVPVQYQGFAFEGAAMALSLLDSVTPWKRDRFQQFLLGPGEHHSYMVHVGAGWAMARIPWGIGRLAKMDPLLRWLAMDGYGFHEGFFHWPNCITKQVLPKRIKGYACRAFDQGLGRSLWFVKAADPGLITKTIANFPEQRRSDLWSGVGLAAAYAGGVDRSALESLFAGSSACQAELAQGAAFAAKARQRAGNPVDHTELACTVICGMNAEAAARTTDDALINLPKDAEVPTYEIWRQRIQHCFSKQKAA